MTYDITEKQREVLERIFEMDAALGYPPTVRELGKAMGLRSTSTIWYHLEGLQYHGLIDRDKTRNRAIRLTLAGRQELGVQGVPCPTCGGLGHV